MKAIWVIVLLHIGALAFGLGGMLIALPNPHLWTDSELGTQAYRFGMQYGGISHILLAAMAMFVFGLKTIGFTRTFVFFITACTVSLSAELIGTSTGFPFGDYSYTSGLGYKIFGDVPFTIPLSWFYMGFASYLLALTLVRPRGRVLQSVLAVVIGAYLLTAWDLVLDPAMAHQDLAVRFWIWDQSGSYFGMPLQNFAGWMATGLLFIGLSRFIWRLDLFHTHLPVGVPLVVYLANMVFAMVISIWVGLWGAVVIAALGALIPVLICSLRLPRDPDPKSVRPETKYDQPVSPIGDRVFQRSMRVLAGMTTTRRRELQIEDGHHLPVSGPVLIVSRHYHHYHDACALAKAADRPLRFLVALDWITSRSVRQLMESFCHFVRWPVILRPERVATGDRGGAYTRDDVMPYLRRGLRESINLLQQGEVLVIFPEGYPTIDPTFTPKVDDHEFLPFRNGVTRILRQARRHMDDPIPVIPTGLSYNASTLTVRFAPPVFRDQFESDASFIAHLERQVQVISQAENVHVITGSPKMRHT